MTPLLRTKTIRVEMLGLDLEIRELSAGAYAEISKAGGVDVAPLIAKHGVPLWEAETVEDIAASVGVMALQEIGREIFNLTGIDLEGEEEKKD